MNILSILNTGTGHPGNFGTATSTTFAGIAVDDVAEFTPHLPTTTSPTGADLFKDLDKALDNTHYSESERVDYILTENNVFGKIKQLYRDEAALPDPMAANLGSDRRIPFGGAIIDWTRYWDLDDVWDTSNTTAAACLPHRGHQPELPAPEHHHAPGPRCGPPTNEAGFSFIRQIGGEQVHAALTNLYKRVEFKRQFCLDNGRRSFFHIDGVTTL